MEIRFADAGGGIPRQDIDKIFEPFFTTMPTEQEAGLGLSVSYGIVQEHGGAIEVESSVGVGTVFTVKLPPHPLPSFSIPFFRVRFEILSGHLVRFV